MKRPGLFLKTAAATIVFCCVVVTGGGRAQNSGTDFDAPVTLNLKDANVADIFRLLADMYDLNIILTPNVRGNVSLRLSNVTLRAAIDVVLEASGMKMEQTDNIIRISAMDEQDEKRDRKSEMITEILTVNYVTTSSLMAVLQDYLSPDGKIKIFDKRTPFSSGSSRSGGNSGSGMAEKQLLIITDYPLNVEAVKNMLEKLDTQTRQVMIEARIVETTMSETDLMGTDWSIGASFLGSPVEMDTKFAPSGKIQYGTLSLGGFSAVYQRLMQDQNTNVLSNAKLAVLDNERAHIHVGNTIPVGVNTIGSGGGGTTSFGTTSIQQWETGVSVDVTPVVLENSVIRMRVFPTISTVQGYASIGSGSAPVTSSRTVDTQILVQSGETIVIGGLVQDMLDKNNKKVPILGDLPFIGSAFRKKGTANTKINLLIFITATILDLKGDNIGYSGETNLSPGVASAATATRSFDNYLEYK